VTAGSERPRGGVSDAGAPASSERPRGDVSDARDPASTEADGIVPLLEPRDGLPPVVATDAALAEVTGRLAEGTGPVAVDAERASGYRYGQRAYLVQLRRAGAGTVLIDPIACPDLSGVDAALEDAEAVLHAASQDLPCLAEIGFRPRRLFDTELAGRLLGYPRVALGTLVEEVLGFHLEKGHSAADWSVRPLREELLRYAALDVEVLTDLRDALAGELEDQGKAEWARQEFEAVLAARPAAVRADPWRRTSGIHRVQSRRGAHRPAPGGQVLTQAVLHAVRLGWVPGLGGEGRPGGPQFKAGRAGLLALGAEPLGDHPGDRAARLGVARGASRWRAHFGRGPGPAGQRSSPAG